ncbi:iron ABC transporter substrate-binding protein [soil metagenome]
MRLIRPGRRTRAATALGALGLALLLAGCGDEESQAEASGCPPDSGTFGEPDEEEVTEVDSEALVVYSGRNEELVGPLYEDFTEETGIEVSVRYGNSATLAGQLLEEGDQSPADVYLSQDAGALGAMAKAGCLAVLPDETLDVVPEGYRSDDGTWVGLTGRARVIVYNPDLVAEDELPESIEDVNDEQWAGEVGIAPGNASFQAFVTAMRVLQGEDEAREFLEGLVDNDVQLYEGNGAILDAVDSGEIAMGLINHYYSFEKAAEVGAESVTAQLHYLMDGEAGSLVNVSGASVLGSADRTEDAQALIEFLLSEPAQTYFAEQTYEYPMIDGVPVAEELPDLASLDAPEIDLTDLDTLAETTAMIEEVGLT